MCIIISTTSYDVVLTMGPDQILQKFMDFDCRLVFSAESFCWPDVSLAVTIVTIIIECIIIYYVVTVFISKSRSWEEILMLWRYPIYSPPPPLSLLVL